MHQRSGCFKKSTTHVAGYQEQNIKLQNTVKKGRRTWGSTAQRKDKRGETEVWNRMHGVEKVQSEDFSLPYNATGGVNHRSRIMGDAQPAKGKTTSCDVCPNSATG